MSQIDVIVFIPALSWFLVLWIIYYSLVYTFFLSQFYFMIRIRTFFFVYIFNYSFNIFKQAIYVAFYLKLSKKFIEIYFINFFNHVIF